MRSVLRSPGTAFLFALTFALWLIVLSPFVVIVLGAFLQTSFLGLSTEQWAGPGGGSALFTTKWIGYVWDLYRDTLGFSIRLALGCVLACLVIGVPGAYTLARHRFPGSDLVEALVMLPLSLPGIAISIALIQAFSFMRGSWWLIQAGHLLYTMPFMVRLVIDALRSSDISRLELAAETLGASFFQRQRWVLLPLLRQAMITGSLLVFCVSWGEFNVSYLLNTPLHQTYPAALYATYTSNSFQVSSAATLLFLAGLIPVLLAIQWIGGDRGVRIEQGV